MIWKVKKGIRQHTLFGDGQGATGYICGKNGKYKILNKDKQPVYFITEETPLIMQIQGEGEGTAKIILSREQSLISPPRAAQLILSWGNTLITMVQSEKRVYVIRHGQNMVGKITGILNYTATVSLDDTIPCEMAALLYALALRMLHEDDVVII